jgi:hypothetical protein
LEKAEVAKLKAYKATVSLKSKIAKKSAMLAKTSAARVKAIASKLNYKLAVAKKAGDTTNIAILEMQVNLSESEVSYSEETVSVSTKEVVDTTTEEISYSSSTMNTIVNSKDHLLKESKRNVSIAMQDIEIIKKKLEDTKARYAKAEIKEEKRRLQAMNSSSSSPSSSPSSEWSSSTSETTETLTTTIQEYEEKLPKLFKHMDVQQTKITKGVKAKARAMVKKHKTNYKNAKTILGSAKDQRLQLKKAIATKKYQITMADPKNDTLQAMLARQMKMVQYDMGKMESTITEQSTIIESSSIEIMSVKTTSITEVMSVQTQIIETSAKMTTSMKADIGNVKKQLLAAETKSDQKLVIRLKEEAKNIKKQIRSEIKKVKKAENKKVLYEKKAVYTKEKVIQKKNQIVADRKKKALEFAKMSLKKMEVLKSKACKRVQAVLAKKNGESCRRRRQIEISSQVG